MTEQQELYLYRSLFELPIQRQRVLNADFLLRSALVVPAKLSDDKKRRAYRIIAELKKAPFFDELCRLYGIDGGPDRFVNESEGG